MTPPLVVVTRAPGAQRPDQLSRVVSPRFAPALTQVTEASGRTAADARSSSSTRDNSSCPENCHYCTGPETD